MKKKLFILFNFLIFTFSISVVKAEEMKYVYFTDDVSGIVSESEYNSLENVLLSNGFDEAKLSGSIIFNDIERSGKTYTSDLFVDLSKNNDGSVMAYFLDYNVYIQFSGTLKLPVDSSYLFADLSYVTAINGLEYVDTSDVTNMSYMFKDCSTLTSLSLGNFNTSKVTNMSYMFVGCKNISSFSLRNFDTSNVTDMEGMFKNCEHARSIDLTGFNTSKVTNMSYMFNNVYDTSTFSISGIANFDTSKVENMSYMFHTSYLKSNYYSIFENWNVSNVKTMKYMFYDSYLENINLNNWDVSNVEDMGYMFANNFYSLKKLDLSKWKTSSLKNMEGMFFNNAYLELLYIDNFDTSNVTDMSSLFSELSSLAHLDIDHFDTSKVTDMSSMFNYTTKLTSLDLSNFDTSNVTNMSRMFRSVNFTSLDLRNFDVRKVTDFSYMFENSSKLTEILFDTNNYEYDKNVSKNMEGMFRNCSSLLTLDLTGLDYNHSYINAAYMFWNCSELTTVYVSKNWSASINYTFYGTPKLVGQNGSKVDRANIDSLNYQGRFSCKTTYNSDYYDLTKDTIIYGEEGFDVSKINVENGTIEVIDNVVQIKCDTAILKRITFLENINTLEKLNSKSSSINLDFNKDVLEYDFVVERNVNKVSFEYELASDKSSVVLYSNGSIINSFESLQLRNENNEFKLEVTSQSGNVRTYIINIYRNLSSNNYLSSIYSNKLYIDGFSKDKLEYNVEVGTESIGANIYPSTEDYNATLDYTFNGSFVSSLDNLEFNVGENTVTIKVTAENKDVRVYTINILLKLSDINHISYLELSTGCLDSGLDPLVNKYSMSVQYNVEEIVLTPVLYDSKSKLYYNNKEVINITKKLQVGSNKVSFKVVSESGNENVYTITINKERHYQRIELNSMFKDTINLSDGLKTYSLYSFVHNEKFRLYLSNLLVFDTGKIYVSNDSNVKVKQFKANEFEYNPVRRQYYVEFNPGIFGSIHIESSSFVNFEFGLYQESQPNYLVINEIDYINSQKKKDRIPVYRMYNPNSGEHLYTTDAHEAKIIYKEQGWGYEGVAWYSSSTGTPVYRLYHPRLGNHLYTSDLYEISIITKQGWVMDFDGAPVMYSSGEIPIGRLYNQSLNGMHHLTTDANEYRVLPSQGWVQEGISLYAKEIGVPSVTEYYYIKF